jgi:hypothetical protein
LSTLSSSNNASSAEQEEEVGDDAQPLISSSFRAITEARILQLKRKYTVLKQRLEATELFSASIVPITAAVTNAAPVLTVEVAFDV